MKAFVSTFRKITVLLVFLVVCSCGYTEKDDQESYSYSYAAHKKDCVYVCSGPKARRYHLDSDCKGLSKCSGRILEMTVEEAQDKGETPCRLCVGEQTNAERKNIS